MFGPLLGIRVIFCPDTKRSIFLAGVCGVLNDILFTTASQQRPGMGTLTSFDSIPTSAVGSNGFFKIGNP